MKSRPRTVRPSAVLRVERLEGRNAPGDAFGGLLVGLFGIQLNDPIIATPGPSSEYSTPPLRINCANA